MGNGICSLTFNNNTLKHFLQYIMNILFYNVSISGKKYHEVYIHSYFFTIKDRFKIEFFIAFKQLSKKKKINLIGSK